MIDVKHCKGCYNDFYNGRQNFNGKNYCWSREKATLVPRLLIHINQAPPYNRTKTETVPDCYKRQQFVTVNPESLTAEGYWR